MLTTIMQKIQSVLHQQDEVKNLVWMDTLTELDELEALKEITEQLAKIQFDSIENLDHRIELVLGIDRKTYRHAKKITHKYLTILRLNKDLESSMYNAVYMYQRQLYVAYTQFLDFYLSQNKTILSNEKINSILCRHLNATFTMAKWRYFDDQPAPMGTWANVCKVIKCAENLSILNTNLFLYDYQKKETSIATILKQGFMMDTLHKGSNYSRLQIQMTEQVLKVWATNPLLLNRHKLDKFQFFIDVEADKGPERIRAVEKFADYRFWKTTRLVDKIEAYLCAVDTQKPLHEFGLEKMASTEAIVKLFKKLRVDWCVEGYERQRRKEKREKRNKLINVSYGLEDICRRLNAIKPKLVIEPIQEDDGLYDFEMRVAAHKIEPQEPQVYQPKQNKLGSENWWLVDESAKGFAVDLGKTYNSWIEPGKLIGYTTPEDKKLLVIAEIKSVRKQANGTFRAGLEVLGSHGTSIVVGRVDRNNFSEALSGYYVNEADANTSQLNTFPGLFLDSQDDSKSNKASLILPRCEYKRGNKLRINIDGDEKVIEMGAPLMKQREWVRVALPA